jgi:peptidylprolyl isomerase
MTANTLAPAGPVVTIAGQPIDARSFLATARFLGVFDCVLEHVVRRASVIEKAKRAGLAVTDAELQTEADHYRQALHLHKAKDAEAWLNSLGYTLDDFEAEMELRILTRKKRASFTAAELEAWWNDHRAEYDQARISHALVKNDALAREIFQQVKHENKEFAKLAQKHSLDEATRDGGGYLGWLRRTSLPGETAARVFAARPGECLAPVKLPQGTVEVVFVHETRRPTLDEARDEILDRLLAKWIADLRAETKVEL